MTHSTEIHGLFLAIVNGAESAVRELVSNGADPNCVDDIGRTPLFAASHADKVQVVKALLELRADPNKRVNVRWPTGQIDKEATPLHVAHSVAVVTALLDAGAAVNAVDWSGKTPLIAMAAATNVDVVNVLIAAGANPHLRQNKRRKQMPYTAREVAEESLDFFKELLDHPRDAAHRHQLEFIVQLKEAIVLALRDAEARWGVEGDK